jgi:hypothetical protein
MGQFVPMARKRRRLESWSPVALALLLASACGGMADDGSADAENPDGFGGSGGVARPGVGGTEPTDGGTGSAATSGGAGTSLGTGNGGGGDDGIGGTGSEGEGNYYCQSWQVAVKPARADLVPNQVAGQSLLVDSEGFSYVVGTSPGTQGTFLLKLDGNGALLWSRTLSAESESEDTALRLVSDGDLLIGFMEEASQGGRRISLLRYDSEGNLLMEYEVADPIPLANPHLEIFETDAGGLDVWGRFSGSWSVGPTTLEATDPELFRLRFASTGEVVEAQQISGNLIQDAVVDEAGITYLALTDNPDIIALDDDLMPVGEHSLEADLLGDRRLELVDGQLLVVGIDVDEQLFLGRFDLVSGGGSYWKAGTGVTSVTSLAVLPDASVVVSGHAGNYADFGGEVLSNGPGDGPFVAAFSTTNEHVWSTMYCSEGGATLPALGFGGGTLRALIAFDYDLELGSEHFDGGPSAVLTLTP